MIGGAQVHVFELARGLMAAGHVVAVFVGGRGAFIDQLRAVGVPVWPLPSLIREIDPRADLRVLAELRAALRAFAPDLVSTHSTKAGWVGRVVARAMGVPVVVTAHGWLLTPGALEPWQRVAWLAERSLAPLSAAVIAVSNYDRAIALEHRVVPADKLRVVHNALPERGGEQQLADPQRAPPKIIAVARLQEPKDPLTLIAALAELREQAWTCELIGDGPMQSEVEAAVAAAGLGERVRLLGARDDVPERLAQAQIFVLPTRREGFPISILEAMRAGLPVVASDVGGIAEAVLDGRTGALVPAADAGALARALAPLIADADRRVALGEAGRRRFVEAFGFATHLRRIWAVYAEAIDSGARRGRPWTT
nr:glycosyltransferase family 4 protein [Pseudenhygromyxa sp. WMMC2535]